MITNIKFKPTFWQKIKMQFCKHKLEDVSLQGYLIGAYPVKYFCTKCGIKKLGYIFDRAYYCPDSAKKAREKWATKYQLNNN